jgi:hypothetical protein
VEFEYLVGRRWEDLDLREVPTLSDVLIWLSPEALRYYFPAFLTAAISDQTAPKSRDIVGFLAPPSAKDRSETGVAARVQFRRLVNPLTAEQKAVIRECLLLLNVRLEGGYSFWGEVSM